MILPADSVVFRCKKGTATGLDIHPTIFGHWANEISEDEEITVFAGIGSKNYAYQTVKKSSGEAGQSVCKIRGLTLSEETKKIINVDQFLQLVGKRQTEEQESISVPQFRLGINKVTKQLNAKETSTNYSNDSNKKRFYDPEVSLTRLWPYGVTSYGDQ